MEVYVIHRHIISAPFGVYYPEKWEALGSIRTIGTYTKEPRPGRFRRVLQTVRPYRRIRAWTNSIGLRNPGLESLLTWQPYQLRNKLISIHGFDRQDWEFLLAMTEDLWAKSRFTLAGVELNVSCPNLPEDPAAPPGIIRLAGDIQQEKNLPMVVKLAPIRWEKTAEEAAFAGIRCFHFCNTLPTPAGGMSGKPLKSVSVDVVRRARAMYPREDGFEIIGGGGITEVADAIDYHRAGADYVAQGSALFNPFNWWKIHDVRTYANTEMVRPFAEG